jgi:hypothetical protein
MQFTVSLGKRHYEALEKRAKLADISPYSCAAQILEAALGADLVLTRTPEDFLLRFDPGPATFVRTKNIAVHRTKLDAEVVQRIIFLYGQELSIAKIAQRCGIAQHTVSKVLNDNGVFRRARSRPTTYVEEGEK